MEQPDRYTDNHSREITARERLEAFVAHESDADQAEYSARLDAYRAEVLAEATGKQRAWARNRITGDCMDAWGDDLIGLIDPATDPTTTEETRS